MPNRKKSKLQLIEKPRPRQIPYVVVPPEERSSASPRAPVRVPRAPKWLPKDAAAIWKAAVKLMVSEKTWRPSFEPLLAAFCITYAEIQRDSESIQAFKLTQFRLLCADLGMTPQTAANLVPRPKR